MNHPTLYAIQASYEHTTGGSCPWGRKRRSTWLTPVCRRTSCWTRNVVGCWAQDLECGHSNLLLTTPEHGCLISNTYIKHHMCWSTLRTDFVESKHNFMQFYQESQSKGSAPRLRRTSTLEIHWENIKESSRSGYPCSSSSLGSFHLQLWEWGTEQSGPSGCFDCSSLPCHAHA